MITNDVLWIKISFKLFSCINASLAMDNVKRLCPTVFHCIFTVKPKSSGKENLGSQPKSANLNA